MLNFHQQLAFRRMALGSMLCQRRMTLVLLAKLLSQMILALEGNICLPASLEATLWPELHSMITQISQASALVMSGEPRIMDGTE